MTADAPPGGGQEPPDRRGPDGAEPDDRPCARLEPLVRALLDRGATLARQGVGGSPFGPSREGCIAVLTEPLDWAYLVARFTLPPDIRYDSRRDVVLDDATWSAVYGSSGSRAGL